jgi:hypothetical protein
MKALTLKPEFAEAIVAGRKHVENPSRGRNVRGRIAIHRGGPAVSLDKRNLPIIIRFETYPVESANDALKFATRPAAEFFLASNYELADIEAGKLAVEELS